MIGTGIGKLGSECPNLLLPFAVLGTLLTCRFFLFTFRLKKPVPIHFKRLMIGISASGSRGKMNSLLSSTRYFIS